ncbi:MAG: hypothetical protein AUK47_19230 [Deltaproteobacteria bacterium CG2_30_63_29]|nr:MAG: hypothetical protein AUK47_19230 [Deltaproteobacteria bacterium CG2_30_63_29]PJB38969.1 MAG: hypothetical protein CO108_18185 [Deltaproteobacteria bacterium CG_4_9_14_3_um_filter_63_12]
MVHADVGGWRPLTTFAAALLVTAVVCTGCGGVYEEVAPPEKRSVALILVPDFVRIGETSKEIDAFVDVATVDGFVTEINLGEGLEIEAFDSRGGCGNTATPQEFEGRKVFNLCISVAQQPSIKVGERRATIEVRTDNEAVLGETAFFVLRALD